MWMTCSSRAWCHLCKSHHVVGDPAVTKKERKNVDQAGGLVFQTPAWPYVVPAPSGRSELGTWRRSQKLQRSCQTLISQPSLTKLSSLLRFLATSVWVTHILFDTGSWGLGLWSLLRRSKRWDLKRDIFPLLACCLLAVYLATHRNREITKMWKFPKIGVPLYHLQWDFPSILILGTSMYILFKYTHHVCSGLVVRSTWTISLLNVPLLLDMRPYEVATKY